MKKILNLILLSVLTFSFAITCEAAEIKAGDKITVTDYSDTTKTGDNLPFGIWRQNYCKDCYYSKVSNQTYDTLAIISYGIKYDGNDYVAYCIDPNRAAGTQVKVKDVIESNTTNPYYAGLYVIASNGYKSSNADALVSTNNNNEWQEYEATNMALRMFNMASGNSKISSAANESRNYMSYVAVLAAETMAENSAIANLALKKLVGINSNCSNAECFYNTMKFESASTKENYSIAKTRVLNRIPKMALAKELFVKGLEVATGDEELSSVANSQIVKSTTKGTEKPDTATHFVEKKYYDITISNFESENILKNLRLTCENCNQLPTNVRNNLKLSITGYSLDNGVTFTNSYPTNDVLSSLTGDTKIVIEVTAELKRGSGYACEDIKYSLDYSYTSVESNDKIILLVPESSSSEEQYYVSIIEDTQNYVSNVNQNNTIDIPRFLDDTINFCDTQNGACLYQDPSTMTDEEKAECCDDWSNACQNGNDYCDYYGTYCAACDTEIIVPTVCQYTDESTDEVVVEDTGYVKSAIDDNGDENIKVCLLLRKEDEAGNSYQAMSNNYCQVYCKEDFQFNFPTGVSVNSGTYFQLEATITGTKTCYTSEIDVNKYRTDLSNAMTAAERTSIQNQYNACVNMEVDYDCFEPVIEYKYDEVYNDQLESGNNNTFTKLEEIVKDDIETTYCSDINDDYSCSGTELSKNSTNIRYVKSTITKSATYKTPSVFYQQRPTGIVSTENKENSVAIDGLPVAVNTEKGTHSFTLSLKNIGEFYDKSSCSLGRLIGAENSIYNKQDQDNNNQGKAEYMCYYDVNCPECDFECFGDMCEIELCDGKECTPTCVGYGCAYSTEAGLNYTYRTVTLNNLNASGRTLGYNWNSSISVKAGAAITEIETQGETAYEEAEYTIKLTPALITAIKDYNKSKLTEGGYADNSLKFEDYTYNGVTYKKLNGKSKFLEDLASGTIGNSSSNVKLPSDDKRFTSWLDSEYCKTNVCKIENGTGPSYK